MILYPDEMDRIARAIRIHQKFNDDLLATFDSNQDINFEGPESMDIKVIDVNGEIMGHIGWTEHGSIGFVSIDHQPKE